MHNSNDLENIFMTSIKGKIHKSYQLSKISWMKVGGPAEWLFRPQDIQDLKHFISNLNLSIPIFILGACSNLLIRDGGISGVCIKLGKNFSMLEIRKDTIKVGASMLTAKLAILAAEEGCDLAFLRTIPGTVGGAVKMNAGCYGRYVYDYLESIEVIERNGNIKKISKSESGLSYRVSNLPEDSIIISATFRRYNKLTNILEREMQEALDYRASVQPTDKLSCGSAFKNPSGRSSKGKQDNDHDLSAWKLIDDAGYRGAILGRAQVSEKHPNFLINSGGATASEIEELGEKIRNTVFQRYGISLNWEIRLVGKK